MGVTAACAALGWWTYTARRQAAEVRVIEGLGGLPFLRELGIHYRSFPAGGMARLGRVAHRIETLSVDADRIDNDGLRSLAEWPVLTALPRVKTVGLNHVTAGPTGLLIPAYQVVVWQDEEQTRRAVERMLPNVEVHLSSDSS